MADDDDADADDDEDYDGNELSLIVAALRRHFLSIIAHSRTVGVQCAFRMHKYRQANHAKKISRIR